MVGGVCGHARWRVELAGPGTQASPLGDEGARRSELLDPVVGEIGHDDVVGEAGRYIEVGSGAKLAVPDARTSPLSDERARRAELLDPRVACVGDVDVARGVGGDAGWMAELAIQKPNGAPLLVELDRSRRRRR